MFLGELAFTFRRRRVLAVLVVLAALPVLIALAVRFGGGPGGGEGPTFLNQVTANGVFAALAGLTVSVPVFLPLAVTVVAGDAVAGEAGLGTLRYLLVRPAGRTRFLLCKAASVAVFSLAAVAVVVSAGLLAGVVLFPVGRIVTLSGDTLSPFAGAVRIVGAAGVVGCSLLGFAGLTLFISTMTDVAVGAMAGALGVLVLSGVVDAVPQLHMLHPWMFTHGWLTFTDVLRTHIAWAGIVRNLELQAAYVAVFGSLAWARFVTKDVLA
jgi:ABC-2 type transport system permease protein